jgi:SOS-response transcriptional repressor LexA
MDAVRGADGIIIDQIDFSASDKSPADYCRERLSEASHYVGIIGLRYGDIVEDKSYVHMEFDTATSLGLTRYVFLLDEKATLPLPAEYLSDPEHSDEQKEFRAWLLRESKLTLKKIKEPGELARFLQKSLSDEKKQKPDQSDAQASLWELPATLPVLASEAERQLQSALPQLREALRIMDRVEHSYDGPTMDSWAWSEKVQKHRDLANSVPGPAAELKACLEPVAGEAEAARAAVGEISERRPTQPDELTSLVGAVSELLRLSQLLVDRIARARNELRGRSADYPEYRGSCEILFQAYQWIDAANADAIRMERTLGSLRAAPDAVKHDAGPAVEQPYRAAASSPRSTTIGRPVKDISTTPTHSDIPLKAAARTSDTTTPTESAPEEPDSVPVAPEGLSGSDHVAVKVEGESMEGAGIKDGDYVIVDTEQVAQDGDIVVVTIEGPGDLREAIVKRIRRKPDGSLDHLVSEYADGPEPFPIDSAQNPVPEGKVVGIFRSMSP